jgi:putative spermidine/putrescine transport system substrate-binding protein
MLHFAATHPMASGNLLPRSATFRGFRILPYRCSQALQCVSLLLLLCAAPLAIAGEILRVLAWPGYADADLVKVFEQRTHAKVEVTLIDSDEALWQKISNNGAAGFDVFAVNTAELQRYIRAALVVPIDTQALPNLARQLPRFRERQAIPGIVHGDKVFAIPYTYAEMGLIYDRAQIKQPPRSISVLWDPQYQGKVLAYNGGAHNFSLAAQALGVPNPFKLREQDWPQAARKLIALRRNVLTFYSQPEESVALFKDRRVALLFANYGSQQVQLLKNAGVDIGYAIPVEGALAWLDCWVITRGARNNKLATAWIDYMLEVEPSRALVSRQGLANTTSAPSFSHQEDRLLWLEPVEDVNRRNQLWERILSGDRIEKVLKP